MPIGSAHSRADGRRHAISDALVWNGDLVAVSKASEELLNLGCAGGRSMSKDPIVTLENVTKRYGGIAALEMRTSNFFRGRSTRSSARTAPASRRCAS